MSLFYLGVGFVLPHGARKVPRRVWDLYDSAAPAMLPANARWREGAPAPAWAGGTSSMTAG